MKKNLKKKAFIYAKKMQNIDEYEENTRVFTREKKPHGRVNTASATYSWQIPSECLARGEHVHLPNRLFLLPNYPSCVVTVEGAKEKNDLANCTFISSVKK